MMASRLVRTSLVRAVRPVAPVSGARFQSTQAGLCRALAVRPAASLMPRKALLPASISFHSSARLKQQASAPVAGDFTEKLANINQEFRDTVEAKSGMTLERWQHAGALGLAVSCPSLLFFTFIYEPSRLLTLPIDVILAFAGPIHGYIGLEAVLTDYVTIRPLQNIMKFLSLVGFFLAILGLLKIAFFDGGLAKAYGAFWTRYK